MASPIKPSDHQRKVVKHYRSGYIAQHEAMKKLKLGKDYHAFYRLFHRCTMADMPQRLNMMPEHLVPDPAPIERDMPECD